jgi:Domain of unknown function (DUF1949)
VRNLLARHGGRLLTASYDGSEADLRVEVERGRSEALCSDLARRTRGAWRSEAG